MAAWEMLNAMQTMNPTECLIKNKIHTEEFPVRNLFSFNLPHGFALIK